MMISQKLPATNGVLVPPNDDPFYSGTISERNWSNLNPNVCVTAPMIEIPILWSAGVKLVAVKLKKMVAKLSLVSITMD